MKDGFLWEPSHQTTGSSWKDSRISSLKAYMIVFTVSCCMLAVSVHKLFLSTVALDRKFCRVERANKSRKPIVYCMHCIYLMHTCINRIYSRQLSLCFHRPVWLDVAPFAPFACEISEQDREGHQPPSQAHTTENLGF